MIAIAVEVTMPIERIEYWKEWRWEPMGGIANESGWLRLVVVHPATGATIASPAKRLDRPGGALAVREELIAWANRLAKKQ